MPRATFSLDALNGATPGLSKLAQAFAGGNGAYQQGYEGELSGRSKIAQAMATAAAQQAKADQDNTETNIVRSRPDLIDENVALEAGTTLPLVRAFQQYTRTGAMPTRELAGPADEAGNGPGVAPVLDDPAVQSRIAQAMRRSLPMRTNVKDTNVEDFAKAAGLYQGQDLTNDVLNGTRTPGQVGAAQAVAGGKPLYHFDSSGLVGDLFGGGLNESSGRAQAVTSKESALGKQATAGAAENYAQAEAARAEAAKRRLEIEQGVKTGMLKLQTGEDGSVVIVNMATGQYRPATSADGIPLMGKGKDLNDSQSKANLFGTRMQESDRILNGLAGKYSPGAINAKVGIEGVPIIGGVAGPIANWQLSDEEQQVEQAQRDFINAVLRRESGAAISPGEFSNATKQYFQQPGDSEAVIRQKARNRKIATEGMLAEVPATKRGVPSLTAPAAGGAPAQTPAAGARPPLSSFQR